MRFKQLLRPLFYASPAQVNNYARRLTRLRVTGHFATFDEALRACAPTLTWTDPRYRRRQNEVIERLRRVSSETLTATALYYRGLFFGHEVASVLDYGGALGEVYFAGQFQHTPLLWNVVDVSEAVEYAKAKGLETDKLLFSDEPRRPHYDIALVSGALQYLSEPLRVVDSLNTSIVILNNLPVTSTETSYVAIQRVRGIGQHPIWIFGRNDLVGRLKQRFSRITETLNADGLVLGVRPMQNTTLICER